MICDGCLSPLPDDPYVVTQMSFDGPGDHLAWAFCSESCVLLYFQTGDPRD